ncbi:MAG: RsmB/NOP family class I SAM-dependent RNA methyltransferase [Acholeplasmatales bacterium]|nr:RsmB/NOP family class I SAM-dependent RNA methyltransferase [Acholeplasmatales bacterium]
MITLDELKNLIGKEYSNVDEIIEGLSTKRKTTFRINLNKTSAEEVLNYLDNKSISYTKSDISENAIILNEPYDLSEEDIYKEGKIYLQSLSSQIPPLFLDLDNSSDILDMCAAPGGKTCEIASITKNTKNIMACEANKIRADKLKYNLEMQNAKANIMVIDARKLDSFFRFDTILLDAPCSGSGTLRLNNPRDLKNFSIDLVKNSSKIQKELLRKAVEILKPGHTLVYSTCSILRVENEDVVRSVLNDNVVIEPITLNIDEKYLLKNTLDGTITVKPSELYEGFFISKIRKIK